MRQKVEQRSHWPLVMNYKQLPGNFFSTGEFSERSVGPGRQPVRRELMARRHMERFLKNRASLKSC